MKSGARSAPGNFGGMLFKYNGVPSKIPPPLVRNSPKSGLRQGGGSCSGVRPVRGPASKKGGGSCSGVRRPQEFLKNEGKTAKIFGRAARAGLPLFPFVFPLYFEQHTLNSQGIS